MEEQQTDPVTDSEPLVTDTSEDDSSTLTLRQKLNIFAVNVTILGYFIPLYAYFVALEQDVNNRIASSYNVSERNREACLQGNITNDTRIHNHIEAEASYWMVLINGTALIPTFFVSLLIGPISDQIGRKVAFLVPTIGTFIKYIGSLLISYFQWPIWSYSIVTFLEGLSGSAPLFYAACVAYTADNTENMQRSFWIVVVDLCLSLSAVIGNFGSGYIITGLGYTWCYIILGIIQLATTLFIVAFIRSTSHIVTDFTVFTTEHFKRTRDLFTKDNGTNRRWKVNVLLAIYCLALLGNLRLSDVLTYTMLNRPLCFSSIMLGNFFSCLHIVMTVGGFLLLLLRRCGLREIPLLYVAYISLIGFEIMVSLAEDEKTIFISTVFSVGLALLNPLINSLMSPLFGPDEQGALFSAVSWFNTFMTMVNNSYQNAIYSVTVAIWRGLVCVVTAGMVSLAAILLTILAILWKKEERQEKIAVAING